MNLCDCYVTKVLGEPQEQYGRWWVEVVYDSYGSVSTTGIMFSTYESACGIGEGYCFFSLGELWGTKKDRE